MKISEQRFYELLCELFSIYVCVIKDLKFLYPVVLYYKLYLLFDYNILRVTSVQARKATCTLITPLSTAFALLRTVVNWVTFRVMQIEYLH